MNWNLQEHIQSNQSHSIHYHKNKLEIQNWNNSFHESCSYFQDKLLDFSDISIRCLPTVHAAPDHIGSHTQAPFIQFPLLLQLGDPKATSYPGQISFC